MDMMCDYKVYFDTFSIEISYRANRTKQKNLIMINVRQFINRDYCDCNYMFVSIFIQIFGKHRDVIDRTSKREKISFIFQI